MGIVARVVKRLQSDYFNAKISLYGVLGLPAQTSQERQLFKRILDTFGNQVIRVFEWGSGHSTIYYARYLNKRGVPFEWHSIDNNTIWHEKVRTLVNDNDLEPYVSLHLREFIPFWEKPEWGRLPPGSGAFAPTSANEASYIDCPRGLKGKFDIVLIDARFRRRCLQTAREVVRPDGIVILHDAQKEQYHPGTEAFPFRTFISSGSWYPLQPSPNMVWVGSLEDGRIQAFLKSA